MFKSLFYKLCPATLSAGFHTTASLSEVRLLTRLRVVDNSEIGKRAMAEGKPPKIICVYNKRRVGFIGDRVMVAIKGQKKKGILVGLKQTQNVKVPKFDSNNVVLIDDNGTPLGTRIHVPIPTILRTILKERTHAKGADYTKILAIASSPTPRKQSTECHVIVERAQIVGQPVHKSRTDLHLTSIPDSLRA
ncbi:hypothetical protein K1T71_008084 [Dendrolimus kikuchii]|uniref:Uncharacterized protein n=1 Tax=Dendrolimus kikuchii TaxID=765133 RepID=A0ACC1CWR9_9NEOP|nr:hypothetical protein K1T71_008084 [Dendrolimus kikuchii]